MQNLKIVYGLLLLSSSLVACEYIINIFDIKEWKNCN